ncbi:IPT/TIG domain-containing protein [Dyella tabacisoli]|uniref:IPT/TIG domain-containing protein n=1 Tax=Dyella tabacisoli TaxID=2282381 RepID=A0A369UN01_9GAMM|nr:IPT/TIG domain-containing protein [Dyella tabacisoli]RDD80980.1 hypothetical protein DVJ77_14880 [Dyella tabacisoli]
MESLDNDKRTVFADIRRKVLGRRCGFFHTLARGLVCAGVLWAEVALAQSSSYVYDANGRVVAVTQSNGASAQYSYDTIGNLVQVSSVSSGQLVIFAFTPTHGVTGAQVLIKGQGFSASTSSNTVTFNGTPATVLSASSTQLAVAVPSGATTGPISVTVGNVTITSATPFIVDDTGLPPMISAVSPSVIAVGGSLAVTGTHLDPIDGRTVMSFGNRNVSAVSSINDSQILYTVTASDTSGFVTVETPYGQAESVSPIIVLPAGLNAANVTSTAYVANGGNASLNISAGGQTGALLFKGNAGDWTSLQLSAINTSASNINYAIYAPGNQLILRGTVSSNTPSIHLPQLSVGGTYLATFSPDSAGAQLAVGIEGAGTLTVGTPATIATTIPGESKRLLFQATSGQAFTLLMSISSTTPVGRAVNYAIYSPGQQSYTNGSLSSNSTINLSALPNTGTYQLIIASDGGATSAEQVDLEPAMPVVLPSNGQLGSYSGYATGQIANLTFTANQGDNLELTLSSMSISGSNSSAIMNVYDANGTNISSSSNNCYQGWTCRLPLWNLAAGKYTVTVSPPSSSSAISFNAMLEPDLQGPTLSADTPATVNLSMGQVERLTFNANSGDNVSLIVSDASTSNPSGLPVHVSIYRPDASPITIANYYTTANVMGLGSINLVNLPVSGRYTAVVNTSGIPGAARLTFTPIVMQPIAVNGTNQAYTGGSAGKSVNLTFTANQGDNLELTLSKMSVVGSSMSPLVNVYDANGTNVSSSNSCEQGWTCRFALWNLASGKYSVVVSPPDLSTAVGFNAILESDLQGPTLSTGIPVDVNLSLGQVERLTFNANAGDNVTLKLSNVSTTNPSGLGVYVNVYRPDVGTITTTNSYFVFSTQSSSTQLLQNLPVSGTYTIVVYTSGIVGSASLELMP